MQKRRFAVCIRNDGYEASLERNKIYEVGRDRDAEREGDLRVIDESGEDYLFAANRFVAIEVSSSRQTVCFQSLSRVARPIRADAPKIHFPEASAQLNPSLRPVGASRD